MFTIIGKCKMNKLITEYPDFADEELLKCIWGSTVTRPNWRFGQKSNNETIFPMWFQGFYDTAKQEWTTDNEYIKQVGDQFIKLCGQDYTLVRCMLSGNTFGQDGDIHDDWQIPGESLTGVLYLNRGWPDSFGGETIVYDKNNPEFCEISKFKAGKLILFDGSHPHIGKGPQRRCGDLRCIIAIQAIRSDVWKKQLDKANQK